MNKPSTGSARIVALSIVALVACTPTKGVAVGDAATPSAKCARFGDTCEFAPGKLGSCVQRTDCVGDDCLVCQSQH